MLWRGGKYLNGCPLILKNVTLAGGKTFTAKYERKNDLHYMYQLEVIKKSYETKTEGVIFQKVRQK